MILDMFLYGYNHWFININTDTRDFEENTTSESESSDLE